SRYGLDTVEGSLIWAGSAVGLALAFARRSVSALAVVGLLLGLGVQVYPSGHVAAAFVAAALLLAALDPRVRGLWLLWGFLAAVGGTLVAMGPLLAAYYRNPYLFTWNAGYTNWLSAAVNTFRAS